MRWSIACYEVGRDLRPWVCSRVAHGVNTEFGAIGVPRRSQERSLACRDVAKERSLVLMMNLKLPKEKKATQPLWLAVFGFFVVAVTTGLLTLSPVTFRPLEVEEKEVVISILSRISYELPQLSRWADDFTIQFEQNGIPAFVKSKQQVELVKAEDDTLIFSNAFFQADAASQRQALADILVNLQPAPQETEPDSSLAVSGK